MMRMLTLISAGLLLVTAAQVAGAASKPAHVTIPPVPKETRAVTHHSVVIDGQTLHYTATAGTLLLRNKKNQPTASVFYIAYTKDGTNSDHRPVTFTYNGGPGFASALVDIGGFGPVHIPWKAPGDISGERPPYRLVANTTSILKSTDLVFIDAVGTGYSRIVGQGKPKDFYGVSEDGKAFAQFIQRYISIYHRWNSPKFLLGESYGTTRNAVLANDLVNNGIYLNGVIMCSTVLDFGSIDAAPGNDLPYISYLPSYAAVAWYHHRLNPMPPNLAAYVKQVEKFAAGPYAQALFKGTSLSTTDKQQMAAQLAHYTGLPESLWLKADLRIALPVFRRNVMGNDTMTGRYDERYTTPELQPLLPWPGRDNLGATTTAYSGALTALLNNYVTQTLNYHSERPYVQSSYKVFRAWDWKFFPPLSELGMGVGNRTTCCGTNVAPALARALTNDPGMQLMMNNGYYDTATPFFATEYTLNHMKLPASIQKNVHWHFYPVGHMLYFNPKVLPRVDHDIDAFIENASVHG